MCWTTERLFSGLCDVLMFCSNSETPKPHLQVCPCLEICTCKIEFFLNLTKYMLFIWSLPVCSFFFSFINCTLGFLETPTEMNSQCKCYYLTTYHWCTFIYRAILVKKPVIINFIVCMWVTMFPSVPAQVFCVNYRISLSCFVKYWGLCKWFKGIVSIRASLGAGKGTAWGFFSLPFFFF